MPRLWVCLWTYARWWVLLLQAAAQAPAVDATLMWWRKAGLSDAWCIAAECNWIVEVTATRVCAYLSAGAKAIPLPAGWSSAGTQWAADGQIIATLDYYEGEDNGD